MLLWLGARSFSQKPVHSPPPERAVALVFQQAFYSETGRNLKEIHGKHIQELCVDGRRWGDGVVGFDRLIFSDQQDLGSKITALVHQWRTQGSQEPLFDPRKFATLRRYSVANCGNAGTQTKVVVVVYRSAWDTYWDNWATLLGK
jgi:hypothetical protein